MEDNTVRLRRYEDDLGVCGSGVIILGVWSSVKTALQIYLKFKEHIRAASYDTFQMVVGIFVLVFLIGGLLFLVFSIYYHIGINAVRAAKGKPYKKGYFVWAIIMLILSALGLSPYTESFQDLGNIDTTFASLLVDLTTIYVFAAVIVSTRKIKKIKNSLMQEQSGSCR